MRMLNGQGAVVSLICALITRAAGGQELQKPAPVILRSAQECVGMVFPPAEGTRSSLIREPSLLRVILPPPLPDNYRNAVVFIQLRVNTAGRVDSMVVSGIPDRAYMREVRQTLGGSVYRPATYDGCPFVRWTSLTVKDDK